LKSYAEKFKEIAAEVENLLEKMTFSVSAVSNSVLEETGRTLKGLENQLKSTQAKLKDLPEIKEDLQETVLQCEQVKIAVNNILKSGYN
jgi:methyl-accepting chemotaxis protein